jgi:hypothetical protein
MRTDLVADGLKMALFTRGPEVGVVFHLGPVPAKRVAQTALEAPE